MWAGDDLGSYLTNNWSDSVAGGRGLADNSEILVDGQQCLHSLEEDVLDKVAVPHAQGHLDCGLKLAKASLSGTYRGSLQMPAYRLTTRWLCAERMGTAIGASPTERTISALFSRLEILFY